MGAKLIFHYDKVGDILHIDMRAPYPEQEPEELEEEILVRLHPQTREVENVEILFYSERLQGGEDLELPLLAHFRLAV